MLVRRVSQLTGKVHERDVPLTREQLREWENGSTSLQNTFPLLSTSEREFLLTGITQEEWDIYMIDEEEGTNAD